MKLISLLISLLLVGFLVMQQLNSSSSVDKSIEGLDTGSVDVPKLPTSPEGVSKFEKDINSYIQDNADKRSQELEATLNQ